MARVDRLYRERVDGREMARFGLESAARSGGRGGTLSTDDAKCAAALSVPPWVSRKPAFWGPAASGRKTLASKTAALVVTRSRGRHKW